MTAVMTPGADQDGIARLRPFDGMFLRAVHLDTLQSYARDRDRLLGRAGGAGTVEGLTVTLDGSAGEPRLLVGAGIAVDPAGTPMRLGVDRVAALPTPPAEPAAWLVEARAADRPSGQEPVYSRLYDGRPGATPTPETALELESLTIGVSRVPLDGLAGVDPARLRSALAGRVFADDLARWESGLPPARTGVGLAMLLWVGDAWSVDTWMVRRDRIDPPPPTATAGPWPLGPRPRSVHLAQILQFRDQLADRLAPAVGDPRGAEGLLSAAGFVDLPPAGALPLPPPDSRTDVAAYVRAMLGGGVDPRLLACDVGTARERVDAARHTDRIPLGPLPDGDRPVPVDVLVPGRWIAAGQDGEDGAGPPAEPRIVPSTDWVAFVRREVAEPAPPPPANATEVPPGPG